MNMEWNCDANSRIFTAKDPLGFRAGDANLYRFAHGDPINRRDPTGLDDLDLSLQQAQTINNALGNEGTQAVTNLIEGYATAPFVVAGAAASCPLAGAAATTALNACLANPAACAELGTAAMGAAAQIATGDSLPPEVSSNPAVNAVNAATSTAQFLQGQ